MQFNITLKVILPFFRMSCWLLRFFVPIFLGIYTLQAQCLLYDSGPWEDIGDAPCIDDCGMIIEVDIPLWGNVAYLIKAAAPNAQYVFSACNGYDPINWVAQLTVAQYDSENKMPLADVIIATSEGCEVTFNIPDGDALIDVIVVVAEFGNCGGGILDNDNGEVTFACGEVDQQSECIDTCNFASGGIIAGDTIACFGDALYWEAAGLILPQEGISGHVWLLSTADISETTNLNEEEGLVGYFGLTINELPAVTISVENNGLIAAGNYFVTSVAYGDASIDTEDEIFPIVFNPTCTHVSTSFPVQFLPAIASVDYQVTDCVEEAFFIEAAISTINVDLPIYISDGLDTMTVADTGTYTFGPYEILAEVEMNIFEEEFFCNQTELLANYCNGADLCAALNAGLIPANLGPYSISSEEDAQAAQLILDGVPNTFGAVNIGWIVENTANSYFFWGMDDPSMVTFADFYEILQADGEAFFAAGTYQIYGIAFIGESLAEAVCVVQTTSTIEAYICSTMDVTVTASNCEDNQFYVSIDLTIDSSEIDYSITDGDTLLIVNESDSYILGPYHSDSLINIMVRNNESICDFSTTLTCIENSDCATLVSGPWGDFENYEPSPLDCEMGIATPDLETYSNESYFISDVPGNQAYAFSFCDGYDAENWEAIISVVDASSQNVVATTTGCALTFTLPYEMDVNIVIAHADSCGVITAKIGNGNASFGCAELFCFANAGAIDEPDTLVYENELEIAFTASNVQMAGEYTYQYILVNDLGEIVATSEDGVFDGTNLMGIYQLYGISLLVDDILAIAAINDLTDLQTVINNGAYCASLTSESYEINVSWVGVEEVAAQFNSIQLLGVNATKGEVQTHLQAMFSQSLQAQIFHLNGQLLYQQTIGVQAGKNEVLLNTPTLAAGAYLLSISSQQKNGQVGRLFVVQ